MAIHCNACNRCIVDFDSHSLVVNNCISGNNRKYLILFLLSLLSFFLILTVISLVHFEKPGNIFHEIEDVLDSSNLDENTDNDSPYKTFMVGIFVVSVITMAPIVMHLRR